MSSYLSGFESPYTLEGTDGIVLIPPACGGLDGVVLENNNRRNDLYNEKSHGKICGSLANPPLIRDFVNDGLIIEMLDGQKKVFRFAPTPKGVPLRSRKPF